MNIISGRANLPLAKRIADHFSIKLTKVVIAEFNDGEIAVEIKKELRGQAAIIVQSASAPVNTHLIELLLLIRAAKECGASRIIAVIPYFAYGRSDKQFREGKVVAVKLIADMLEAAGIDGIITIDIHNTQILDFFNKPIFNLEPVDLYLDSVKYQNNLMVVSPDVGGRARAANFAEKLAADLAVIAKERILNSKCIMHSVDAETKGKHCLIVDDIIDTGNTIVQAVDFLWQNGAESVNCLVTHGILSGNAADKLETSNANNIYLSNSMNHKSSSKFKMIDISGKIVQEIQKFL